MNKKLFIIFLSLIMAIVLSGTVSAATTNNDTCADPIINGTVTIYEYGNTRPLPNATVTVNSTGSNSRVLATTTTDANGYYSVNFYSTSTQFLVTSSYMGCNSVTQNVNVSPSSNPQDPNYYGTSNFQLTPKTATLISTGNGRNVYVAKSGTYNNFAGVINVRIDGTSYQSYCIDLFTPISINDVLLVNGPLPGTTGKLPSTVEWAKVNYIIHNYTPSNNTEAAAIQCAIWYFTSAHYGPWPGNDPAHPGYYQFMTHPDDAKTSGGGTTIRTRALQIINEANAMNYPSTVILEPEITRVANGTPVTLTATVRDQNGNPLSNVTVKFTTNRGSLSVTTGTTNAQGQLSTVLSGVGNNRTATVTAWVEGKYGALLYDDENNPKQNLVCMNLLPYNLADTSQINFDETANVEITQTVNNSVVNVGDQINFTITLRNNGPSTATGIMIQDIIPEGLDNLTVIPSVGTFFNNLWVIPSLANGATATLNIIGTVTASMAGLTVTNTATRTGQDQYNSLPGAASASVYTKMAMIDIDQTVNTPVNVGDIVTYIVSVTNSGPDTATNIMIEDHPPTNLANLTVTPSLGTFINGIWTIPSLANGTTATLTISGNATTVMAGTFTPNTATIINQTEYDPHTIGESTTKETYTKEANVALSQSANYHGNIVTFTVNATNNGPDTATNINITNTIPAGLTNVTVTPSLGIYENGVWIIPSLENGVVATLTIVGTAVPQSTITNTATKTGQTEYDPSTQNKINYTLYVPSADVRVSLYTSTGKYTNWDINNVVTWVADLINLGPDDANNVVATILLPEGLAFRGVDTRSNGYYDYDQVNRIITWYLDFMPSGGAASLNFFTFINKSGDLSVTLTKTSQSEYDPNNANNVRTRTLPIPQQVDIKVVQNVDNIAPVIGEIITYTILIENNGPGNATGLTIKDLLPEGLTFLSANTNGIGSYDENTGIWTIGNFNSKETATLTIKAIVNNLDIIKNTAKLEAVEQFDWNFNNNSQTTIINQGTYRKTADVRVSLYTSTGKYTNWDINNVVTWVADLINLGPDDANNVVATILLPEGLAFRGVDTRSNGYYDYDQVNRIITWYLDFMPSGGAASLNFFTFINKSGDLSVTLTKTSQSEYDPNNANNVRTRTLPIPQQVNLSINQDIQGLTINEAAIGDEISINVNIENQGDDATGLTIKDLLPEGLTFLSANTNGIGSYDENTGIWTIGNFNSKETATLTIKAIVNDNANNTVINSVKLETVDQFDWNFNDNSKKTYLNIIERD